MREMSRDEGLLNELTGSNSLLDSNLKKYCAYEENGGVKAEFTFEMRPGSSYRMILLRFEDVKAISFYYNDGLTFYNVERFKFFMSESKEFYLALDPADEDENISEEDQDIVLARSVVGFSL